MAKKSRGTREALRNLLDSLERDPERALQEIERIAEAVRTDKDLVEALSGHICDENCWHSQVKKAFRDFPPPDPDVVRRANRVTALRWVARLIRRTLF